jgi:hypothetical protein
MLVRQWFYRPETPTAPALPAKPANAPVESRRTFTSVTDGLSNTLLVGEKQCHTTVLGSSGGDNESWNNSGWDQDHVRFAQNNPSGSNPPTAALPEPDHLHPNSGSATFWSVRFGGSHPGVFTAVMGDGSVKAFRYSGLDADNWLRICQINDGQAVNLDY